MKKGTNSMIQYQRNNNQTVPQWSVEKDYIEHSSAQRKISKMTQFSFSKNFPAARLEMRARIGLFRLEAFLLALSQAEGTDKLLSRIVSALEYHELVHTMRKHVSRTLTLAQLSEMHHISESYIKKLFRIYADEGAMTYFKHLQVGELRKILDE